MKKQLNIMTILFTKVKFDQISCGVKKFNSVQNAATLSNRVTISAANAGPY